MNASTRRTRRMKQGLVAVVAMVLSTGLAACGSSGSTSSSTTAASAGASGAASAQATWPVTIKGDDGVDVEITSEPKSIVSTSVTLTGSLLAIDAPVVASTPAKQKDEKTDDNGFFTQWSKQATDKGVKAIDGTEDNLAQTVAGDNPDLIIVAKTGQDSAVKVVDSLRQLEVPVLVIDYGSHSWQDVTKTLGQATGRQAKADSVIQDYNTKAEKAKSAISVPQGSTSVFTVPGDGTKGANAFTEEAPQVQLLKDLGFTIAAVPDSVKGDQSMGERKDIVQLSPENVQAGLTGDNWVVIAANETAKTAVTSNETFSSAAPVTGGKVQYMPPSSFRLDYYSALEMLDAVQKAYPKAS
ncbi:Fe2+-enterobactin ABC transporter substrate-binding protein [Actinomyces sp. ZJ308]|uniref:Fe2+-enterobactin ABC transporter substrate-binding protein n=1 Tax=Actinomyces sp. ZJ308 TaxID=2708342 RepID=UPI00141F35DA|nr:Fe2+-enterobactin ABC transporter substrate-binding protein [Actinomyces sp. ZJ308]